MGNLGHGFRGTCWISTGPRLDFEVLRGGDTDSILHTFYRNVKAGKASSTHGLLPNMTAEEMMLLAERRRRSIGSQRRKRSMRPLREKLKKSRW